MLPDGALFSINPRCTADGIILVGGSNPGQRELDKWLKRHPESCVDDGLALRKEVTDAVREFVEQEFDGWEETIAGPGELYDYSWSGIIALVSVTLLTLVFGLSKKSR